VRRDRLVVCGDQVLEAGFGCEALLPGAVGTFAEAFCFGFVGESIERVEWVGTRRI